jgi:hypothetical protein
MKIVKDRLKQLYMPSEWWYYATLPREEDKETMWTSEQYEALRSYEPMMYRRSYEEYVTDFHRRQQVKYDYMARAVAVTRDTVEEVYTQVTSLPDFIGWLVKGE